MADLTRRFFLLTPTYRAIRGVTVVHLYGVTDEGESALLVDDRARPYFFIPAADLEAAKTIADPHKAGVEPDLVDMEGRPVARLSYAEPWQVPPRRDALIERGIPCFEADIRFAYRYMIDVGLRGTARVTGQAEEGRHTDLVFRRPTFESASFAPQLSVLALDIETDRRANTIYSVSLVGAGMDTVLLVSPRPVVGAEVFPDERAMLEAMVRRVAEADPDVLTGWNVVDFDLRVLLRRASELRVALPLGRGEGSVMIHDDPGFTRQKRATVPGRQILDGIGLVRDTGIEVANFRLATVAEKVLGDAKLAAGAGRVDQIERAFVLDPEWLVAYNRKDSALVIDILEKTGALRLAVERSLLTGMPLDRVGATVASFDFLYLGELRRRGRVAPAVPDEPRPGYVVGGTVLDSAPGLFENVAVLDFKSLYPSIIRTFGIDPYAFEGAGEAGEGRLAAPNGAVFRRGDGILPGIIERLMERRERAKREADSATSTAVKLLMNSFYGVLGTHLCRFAEPAIANAITSFGGAILRRAKREIEGLGFRVLYGDTDSIFVLTGADSGPGAEEVGKRIRMHVNERIAAWCADEYDVESHLDFELERVYLRLFMPNVRGGATGSKKRYAGLAMAAPAPQLRIVGLEAVRRDWPRVGRDFQTEMLRRVFHDEDVEAFVRQTVVDLRAGRLDPGLVYRRVLRKDPDEYVRSSPPHVQAARQAGKKRGSVVRYVVTRAGPLPVDADGPLPKSIDYEHYVRRVLEPIADAILPFLGRRFEEVSGADPQLRLF